MSSPSAMPASYPRYRFDHAFGERPAAPVEDTPAPAPDPLDLPLHSERTLQTALAEARAAAHADGVLQGRREGEALAARMTEAKLANGLDELAGRLDGLDAAHAELLERLDAEGAALLVTLVRRLAPRLLDGVARVEVARAEMERAAGEALRAALGAPVLTCHVHPDFVGPLEARLASRPGFQGRVEIVPDPALAPGALDAAWGAGGLRRDPSALAGVVDALARRAIAALAPPSTEDSPVTP